MMLSLHGHLSTTQKFAKAGDSTCRCTGLMQGASGVLSRKGASCLSPAALYAHLQTDGLDPKQVTKRLPVTPTWRRANK